MVTQGAEGDDREGEHDVGDDRDGGVQPVGGLDVGGVRAGLPQGEEGRHHQDHDGADRLEGAGAGAGGHGSDGGDTRRGERQDQPDGPGDVVGPDVGDGGHEHRRERHAPADEAPGPREAIEPAVVQDGEARGEDGAGTQQRARR